MTENEAIREYPVRTQEYVENECRNIVDQIVGGKQWNISRNARDAGSI